MNSPVPHSDDHSKDSGEASADPPSVDRPNHLAEHPTLDPLSANTHDEIATISLQNTEQMWDLLSGQLDEFYQAWESKSPPDLKNFLPESPRALRKFVLVELIKVDLEHRLEQGFTQKSVTQYAQEFPELLSQGKVEPELLFEEIELRKKFGQTPSEADYASEFPAQLETIRQLLGHQRPEPKTRVLSKKSLANFRTGTQIDDFELIMELGKGAFATVFLARQISMQRLVALKVSNDQGDEPKTLAQLDCKNIVRVYDVRDILQPQCRLLYMKFVAGGSLYDVIRATRELSLQDRSGASVLSVIDEKAEKTGQDIPLDSRTRQRILGMEWFEIVFWFGSEIAEGLAYAHEQEVLHRDLKPANILLTTEGVPQIVDFNVSFCSNVEGASAESFFGGSLAYMSPEQLEAFDPLHPREPNQLDAASDLYSLGIIVWELMFGSRPMPDEVADGDFSKLLGQLVEQRSTFRVTEAIPADAEEIDVDLVPVFKSLLDPEPDKRVNNAREISGELSLLADRQCRELLRPKPNRLNRWMQNQMVVFVVLAVVIPSLLAAVFNYFYNFVSIIWPKGPEVRETFQTVQAVINSIAFPVGIGILILLSLRLYRSIRDSRQASAVNFHALRIRIIKLAQDSVLVPICIWTLAGAAYPIAMKLGNAEINMADSLHFLTSLVLCGLIAAVYPFFLISYVAIRYWYPLAFRTADLNRKDIASVETMTNRVWFFMLLGVMLPTFSMLLMVATQNENDRIFLAVLAGASFIGLGFIFLLFRKLQTHLETLRVTIFKLIENRSGQLSA